jgi:hypothetical protein
MAFDTKEGTAATGGATTTGAGGGVGAGKGAGGGKGVEVHPAKITTTLATRRSGICLKRNGANMFIGCLEKGDGLRNLILRCHCQNRNVHQK